MPSFDIVSETDMHEMDNAVQSVTREIKQRYDFKDSKATIERKEEKILILADNQFMLDQMHDMLKVHVTRRKCDIKSLEWGKVEKAAGNSVRQEIKIIQGIAQDIAKEVVKLIKLQKIKVQSSVRGEVVRVEGKKLDELQAIIQIVKENDFAIPLQFINFRD